MRCHALAADSANVARRCWPVVACVAGDVEVANYTPWYRCCSLRSEDALCGFCHTQKRTDKERQTPSSCPFSASKTHHETCLSASFQAGGAAAGAFFEAFFAAFFAGFFAAFLAAFFAGFFAAFFAAFFAGFFAAFLAAFFAGFFAAFFAAFFAGFFAAFFAAFFAGFFAAFLVAMCVSLGDEPSMGSEDSVAVLLVRACAAARAHQSGPDRRRVH